MMLPVRVRSFCALLCLAAVVGCDNTASSVTGVAGPTTGPFTNASLSGSYVFSFIGVNSFGLVAVAGSFQANGAGAITGGTIDVNSGNGVFTNQSVSGTYTVQNNGHGIATLASSVGTFDLDFAITAGQGGLVIRFDNSSTASGTIAPQNLAASSLAALAGSFVFNLSGIDATGNTEASVGVFTFDNAGNITRGVQDTNDRGVTSANVAVTPASVAVSSPIGGRGTLTITTGATVRQFVYYVADANHLKLVETDASSALGGDAFRQTATAVPGSLVFTVAGASTLGAYVAGGIISTDGAGNVTSPSAQDVNSGGSVTQNVSLGGTYSVAATGRGTMALNGGTINFAMYPSIGGFQLLEMDPTIVAFGVGFPQSAPFSNASFQGTYAMNFSGEVRGSNEIDSAAELSADGSGHFTGSVDINDGGILSNNLALTGAYSIAATGRGTGTFISNLGTQNVILYVVNSTRVLFIEIDASLIAVGEFDHQ